LRQSRPRTEKVAARVVARTTSGTSATVVAGTSAVDVVTAEVDVVAAVVEVVEVAAGGGSVSGEQAASRTIRAAAPARLMYPGVVRG
jgi:hypothetical protein